MLEAAERVAKIFAAAALPIVLLVIGSWYSSSQSDRTLAQKYVEIASGILAGAPESQDRELREWAVAIINRYSEVEFTAELREKLVQEQALPPIIEQRLGTGFRDVVGERSIDEVVVQDTLSSDVDSELAGLQEAGVSYHYLILANGDVRSLVEENDVAFHTSGHNANSIGIGLMHVLGQPYPPEQVAALTALLQDVLRRRGLSPQQVKGKSELDPNKRSDFATIKPKVLESLQ